MKPTEWASLLLMACLLVLGCVFLPVVSAALVEPYIASVYGVPGQDIATDNLWLASICTVVVVLVLFAGVGARQRGRRVDVYLAGVSRDGEARSFQNALSGTAEASARNWYMESVFGEARIAPVGVVFNALIIVAAFAVSFVATPIVF